ncbi:PucR C-terminal helix-turn-helix domain-containing protein [Pilibacter termitis]|uniref:PucR C-terminal helix-turn-helix domain-containing protein n=1 Tax=Pilibacter termitis TaxID=263852 RepID=A0A1T4PVH0_9ENTE|nr:helix-turn-helix domain-containing protein [Pilibacter termitis]SJZ95550.1 PucR C-terminal helix-turn-helix domain-containing protein [Pilibacter termitis]
MNKKELCALYPQAKIIQSEKDFHHAKLNLLVESEVVAIPKGNLSKTEETLLKNLFSEVKQDYFQPWFRFLCGKGNAPKEMTYRVIQYQTTGEITHYTRLLSELLPTNFSFCNISKTHGFFLEEHSSFELSKEEYRDVFAALDNDLSVETFGYIGNFYHTSVTTSSLFQEEMKNFEYVATHFHTQGISTLSEVMLHKTALELRKESGILQYLKKELEQDSDMVEIIKQLWINQGSISHTAKYLNYHRNSLQYKMKKFEERYDFSLKDMNELYLCYLLVI